MSVLHSSYIEQLPSGRRVWSMRRPDSISEEVVRAERSYLPDHPSRKQSVDPVPVVRPVSTPAANAIFDKLYRDHHTRIQKWAARFFHFDLDLAHDAAQKVWMGVLVALPQYDPYRGGESTFLNAVAFGTFCQLYSGYQARPGRQSLNAPVNDKIGAKSHLQTASFDECSSDEPSLEEQYGDELRSQLHILTLRDRFIVEHHWDGDDFSAIAKCLDLSGDRVGFLYRAAVRTLGIHMSGLHGLTYSEPLKQTDIIPIGTRVGYLTVVAHGGTRKGYRVYECRCDKDGCGRTVTIACGQLGRAKGSMTCGKHPTRGKKKI